MLTALRQRTTGSRGTPTSIIPIPTVSLWLRAITSSTRLPTPCALWVSTSQTAPMST